jgi:cobalt-zinc-cadmium efflux system outer membrane protein
VKTRTHGRRPIVRGVAWAAGLASALWLGPARAAEDEAPTRITLDQAIERALVHNNNLRAARTTIEQSQDQETTANLRPNPTLSAGLGGLPLFSPQGGLKNYLRSSEGPISPEVDLELDYTLERGGKRGERLRAAKDATSVTRSQVADNERTLIFQVTSGFINVQLAESTLALAKEDLKSFQSAVDIADSKYKAGGTSENDYLKIKLQMLQFLTDVEQAELGRAQGLSDLRQLLGYEMVSAEYDVAGVFEYASVPVKLEELQKLAWDNRPDLRAAQQSVAAAKSQLSLAEANGKQDVTASIGYSKAPLDGPNVASVGLSIPLAIFNRNQGEIARTRVAVTQAELQQASVLGQVMTDVRDAYEGLQRNDRITQQYRSGYLDVSKKSRDISEYAYKRGGTSLFDFLDAERSYRETQLSYRQALAAYLLAVEQVRQAVGTRRLP